MRRTAGRQKHPRRDKLPQTLRQPARRNHQADCQRTRGKHIFARKNVGQPRQRYAHEQKRDHACGPRQKPQLRIAQPEIMLDPFGQHAERHLVKKDHECRQHDHQQRPVPRCDCGIAMIARYACGVDPRPGLCAACHDTLSAHAADSHQPRRHRTI